MEKKKLKTLDERIETDLKELYKLLKKHVVLKDIEKAKPVSAAKELSEKLFDGDDKVDDAYALSCYGLPSYFTGKRSLSEPINKAEEVQTVMVMLNPGNDVLTNDNPFNTLRYIRNYGISLASPEEFIRTYKEGYRDFGKHPSYKVDNFDLKQAVFLSKWENTGVDIPEGFPDKIIVNSDKKISNETEDIIETLKEQATRNVLTQKLQLELVPYASRNFDTNTKSFEALMPYLETLLHEIFRTDREYVIFCSAFFDKLLEYAHRKKLVTILDITPKDENKEEMKGRKCKVIMITYGDHPPKKALIANSFSSRALSNAYDKMRQYGKFCYECWTKSTNNK